MDRQARIRSLIVDFLQDHPHPDEAAETAFCGKHPDVANALRQLLPRVKHLDAQSAAESLERLAAEGTVPQGPAAGRATEAASETLPLESEATPPAGTRPLFDGRYRVVRTLGEGGFGRVDLVEDTLRKDERIALKVILPEHNRATEFERRFQNEISVLRALRNPGISQIFNDGRTADGEFYYTMEFVDGVSLEELLKRECSLGPMRIVRLVRQLTNILDYAHSLGVVHRDLKPGNILIVDAGSEDEQVKVLDFGIAKILRTDEILDFAQTMQTQAAMGTPHYMAPEQVRGKDIDARADLYALGVIIYRMVSSRYPFKGKTAMEIATARIEQDPAPLEVDDTPSQLSTLIRALLQRERESRPTPDEIRLLLEELASGHRDFRRFGRQMLVGVGALAVLGLFLARPWTRGGASESATGAPESDRSARESHTSASSGGSDTGGHLSNAGPAPQPAPTLAWDGIDGVAHRRSSASIAGKLREFTGSVVEARTTRGITWPLDIHDDGSVLLDLSKLEPGRHTIELHDRNTDTVIGDALEVVIDDTAPAIEVEDQQWPESKGRYFLKESGAMLAGRITGDGREDIAIFEIEGAPTSLDDQSEFEHILFSRTSGTSATETITFRVEDTAGNRASRKLSFVYDPIPPEIEFRFDGQTRSGDSGFEFERGTQRVDVSVRIRDEYPDDLTCPETASLEREEEGLYRASIDLEGEFERVLEFTATDLAGNDSRATLTLREAATLTELLLDGVDVLGTSNPTLQKGTVEASVRLNRGDHQPRLVVGGKDYRFDGAVLTSKIQLEQGENEIEVHRGGQVLATFTVTVAAPRCPRGFEPIGSERWRDEWPSRILYPEKGIEFVIVPPPEEPYTCNGTRIVFDRPFYISRTEVTWGQFGIESAAPEASDLLDGIPTEEVRDHPVVFVSPSDAQQFCDMLGTGDWDVRLPTSQEWLHAAAGEECPDYPWGREWDEARCRHLQHSERTAPVEEYPDESWCRARGMAGNVREWCADGGQAITRGGSWADSAPKCKLGNRNVPFEEGGNSKIGFRIVIQPKQP